MLVFVIAAFTVYRLTLLLHTETGPFKLLEKWHNWLDGNIHQFNPSLDGSILRFLRDLFECYYCLSFWVAFPVALTLAIYLHNWIVILVWPALSGMAIVTWEVANNVKR